MALISAAFFFQFPNARFIILQYFKIFNPFSPISQDIYLQFLSSPHFPQDLTGCSLDGSDISSISPRFFDPRFIILQYFRIFNPYSQTSRDIHLQFLSSSHFPQDLTGCSLDGSDSDRPTVNYNNTLIGK